MTTRLRQLAQELLERVNEQLEVDAMSLEPTSTQLVDAAVALGELVLAVEPEPGEPAGPTDPRAVLESERDGLNAKSVSLSLLKVKETPGSPEWCSLDAEQLGLQAGMTALVRVERAMADRAPVERTQAAELVRAKARRCEDEREVALELLRNRALGSEPWMTTLAVARAMNLQELAVYRRLQRLHDDGLLEKDVRKEPYRPSDENAPEVHRAYWRARNPDGSKDGELVVDEAKRAWDYAESYGKHRDDQGRE